MDQRKIIWFAIVTSTFIYAAILWSLSRSWPQPGAFEQALRRPMVPGLYIAAAVMFLVALTVPRAIGEVRQRLIVTLALFESCAIFGLVAAFLTQDWRLYAAPWAVSLIGFIVNYPRD